MKPADYYKTPNKIQFFTPNGYCWVEAEKILYLKAEAKKVRLFLSNNLEILLDMSLTDCYNSLIIFDFFYLNRTIVVNLEYVFQLINLKGNRAEVVIPNGVKFGVSRRRKETLLNAMKKMTGK